MVFRVWRGWTTSATADAYQALLVNEIFPAIHSRQIVGYHGIQLLRRQLNDEVEFVTIMQFDTLDAVRAFAGQEYEVAVVPAKARALLSRFDAHSQHYDLVADLLP